MAPRAPCTHMVLSAYLNAGTAGPEALHSINQTSDHSRFPSVRAVYGPEEAPNPNPEFFWTRQAPQPQSRIQLDNTNLQGPRPKRSHARSSAPVGPASSFEAESKSIMPAPICPFVAAADPVTPTPTCNLPALPDLSGAQAEERGPPARGSRATSRLGPSPC